MSSLSSSAGVLLLCIDMQPVFIRAMADSERVQRRCAFALGAAHGLGFPVAFSEQVPRKLGGTDPVLLAAAPGAPVFAKNTFSALADDAIHRILLDERKIDHLLLCGIETPVCVYQTAVAALAAGLTVTVLTDAVGARRPDDAAACLAALSHAGAYVLPSESVFYALLHDVKHPFFKAYTALVKAHA
jgi:nicotinamidase-related amidase